MKRLATVIACMAFLHSKGQLLATVPSALGGIREKAQLWNLMLTNTTTAPLAVQIELTLTDNVNAMPVMSATTKLITVNPGSIQVNNMLLQPIQYNLFSSVYSLDAGPNGFLPVGNFDACYSFIVFRSDVATKVADQCVSLLIEPLSPPMLVAPFDQDTLENNNPQLSWLPPMPANLFRDLRYDLQITDIYQNQSAVDAVQQNVPVFQQQAIAGTSLLYPVSAHPLQENKDYAWRVVAKSNGRTVGQSQTWTFRLRQQTKPEFPGKSNAPFAELKKTGQSGYVVAVNEISFSYLNDNADTVWKVNAYDLSLPEKPVLSLPMDEIRLKPGLNLVRYPVASLPFFVDKHLYLLQVINSRRDAWEVRVEYRKKE